MDQVPWHGFAGATAMQDALPGGGVGGGLGSESGEEDMVSVNGTFKSFHNLLIKGS